MATQKAGCDVGVFPITPVSNNKRLLIISGLGIFMLAMGLFITNSPSAIMEGLKIIWTHPSRIDFDSFFWVKDLGYGIPYIQVALNIFMVTFVYKITNTQVEGPQLAALGMVIGFGFYGKNILNMWFPLSGVLLYGKFTGKKASQSTALGFFACCLVPFVNTYAFDVPVLGPFSPKAILFGMFLGVLLGALTALIGEYTANLHGGLLLYNAGLAAGWAAMVVYSILKAVGLGLDNPNYGDSYTAGENKFFLITQLILFAYLVIVGLLLNGIPGFKKLFWFRCTGDNHVKPFGFGGTFLTMGVVGILATFYVILVGGELNGAVFAATWAAAGFSANGSTPRTHLPLLLGVACGAFITGGVSSMIAGGLFLTGALAHLSARGMILSALFTVGVAPVTGNYGVIAGFVVGLIHSAVVVNTGILHGWMSLYNNGFCLGLITILLYPFYSRFLGKDDPEPILPTVTLSE